MQPHMPVLPLCLLGQHSVGLQGTAERRAAVLLGGACCRRPRPAHLLLDLPVGVPLYGSGPAMLQ